MASGAYAQALDTFAVLGGSTVTNTGSSVINGNIGVSPGSAITGFPPGIVNAPYTIHDNDAVAAQAQSDLTTAYNVLAGRPFNIDLTGQDLGGQTLVAGVYNFNNAAQLNGILTLDGQGNSNAVFVINIGSTLTTGSSSRIELINGAQAANVFFRVGSSATLGTTTVFQGKILALTSITLNTGATINCGAALARNGAVTLDTNVIGICPITTGTIGTDLGGTTVDENAVAAALDAYFASGGVLPLGFQVLGLLTPDELAAALTQISGETATAIAPTGTQAMDSFLNLVLNGQRGAGIVTAPGPSMAPGEDTVSVMGYGAEGSPVANSAFAAFNGPGPDTRDLRVNVWVAGFGDYSRVAGDAGVGSHDRTSRDFGLATGVDYHLTSDTKVGFAVAGGVTGFDLADGLGDGHSWMAEVAAYGEKDVGNAYLSGALGYGFHNESTSRYVTFAGVDNLTAQFTAHDVAGQLEAGYRLGVFTPFAAVRGHAFIIPGYSEGAAAGNSTFALAYDGHTVITARTEVGGRLDWTTDLNDGGKLGLHASAAWAHDFWWNDATTASFIELPGSSITVNGATPGADSALLTAGAEMATASGMTLAASLNGGFASNAQTYGGSLRVGYSW